MPGSRDEGQRPRLNLVEGRPSQRLVMKTDREQRRLVAILSSTQENESFTWDEGPLPFQVDPLSYQQRIIRLSEERT